MATLAFRLTIKPRHTLASAIVQIMPKWTLDISIGHRQSHEVGSRSNGSYIWWTTALTAFVIRISRRLAKEPSALTFTLAWVPEICSDPQSCFCGHTHSHVSGSCIRGKGQCGIIMCASSLSAWMIALVSVCLGLIIMQPER